MNLLTQRPVPGYWYSNCLGQLQQVRVILHEGCQKRHILLENTRGKRQLVDLDGWYRLDLTLHSPSVEYRRLRRGDPDQRTS